MNNYAQNIALVLARATDEQVDAGMNWYHAAHSMCIGWARRYGADVPMAAGVLAATSQRQAWDVNVAQTEHILSGGTIRGMRQIISKVERILAGEGPAKVLSGDKIRSFYDNILDPEGSRAVTVDRHAIDIAVGTVGDDASRKKVLRPKGAYETVADAYREVADIAGLLPHQVQAITWLVWRAEKKG